MITKAVTILNGASLSDAADLRLLGSLVGLVTDSAWDTNAISLAVSIDGVNYVPLRYAGSEWSEAAVPASNAVALNYVVTQGWRWIKVRSGTSGSAVNQSGDTVITLVARHLP